MFDPYESWATECRAAFAPGSSPDATPRGRVCPACGIDEWLTDQTPDDEEWTALHYCACCGFLSIEWRT